METKHNLSDYTSKFFQEWLKKNLVDGQVAKKNGKLSTKYFNAHKKSWLDIAQGRVSQVEFVPSIFWIIIPTFEQIEKYISEFCKKNNLVWSYVLRGLEQRVIEIYNSDLKLIYSTSMQINKEKVEIQESRTLALKWVCKQIHKSEKFSQTNIAV